MKNKNPIDYVNFLDLVNFFKILGKILQVF